jgi:hypothetical protein
VLGNGSQQIMDGDKMLKYEANCYEPNNTMKKNLNQMTSIPLGPSVPSTMTTASTLTTTKHSVGLYYVIRAINYQKESNHISQPGGLGNHMAKDCKGIWSVYCNQLGV